MYFDIWQTSYYNSNDYFTWETLYFETEEAAKEFCRRRTEEDEWHYYYCTPAGKCEELS